MTAEQLFYVVHRLANQTPVRYYLDAKGDGSYSHVCLEVYFLVAEKGKIPPEGEQLRKDLMQYGMVSRIYRTEAFPFPENGFENGFYARRYFAKRDQTEQGGKI